MFGTQTSWIRRSITVSGMTVTTSIWPGTAISYFTGHGFCNDGCSSPQQSCTTTAACKTPNAAAGQSLPASCRFSPLDKARCCYMADRSAATSGQYDVNGGRVNYTSGPIRWGEQSQTSGGWAQAGTDGGTNLVVLDISCGHPADLLVSGAPQCGIWRTYGCHAADRGR